MSLGLQATSRRGRYRTGAPDSNWEKVNPGSADQAWFNQNDGAAIYTDSNCGRRYEDGALKDMAAHLTRGIAKGAPLHEKSIHLAGREAMVHAWEGMLDGVQIRVGVMVLKRNQCVYDALLIAPERSFERAWTQFERVYSGFQVEGQ